MGRPKRDIGILQNSEQSINRLRAISVAHRRAQRAQGISLLVSVLVAASSLAAIFAGRPVGPIALAGTAWAVFYATILVPWSGRYLRQAAVLQEMFDVDLFGIAWNQVMAGERVAKADINRLAARYRGPDSRLRDYYVTGDRLSYPDAVLFCIEQNLSWGPRVRQRYATFVALVGVGWSVAGVAVALAREMTVTDLITQWFAPSLGLLLLCLDLYRAQTRNIAERERALAELRSAPAGMPPDDQLRLARQLQDVTLQMRLQHPRVPNWFFRWFHDRDLSDFLEAARSADRLAYPPQSGGTGGSV